MLKFFAILFLTSLAIVSAANACTGCIEPLQGQELRQARNILIRTLSKVDASKGPSYKVAKINKATMQVVQGYLYRYNVNLTNDNNKTLTCKVEIWEFMNETTIEIYCPGKVAYKKKFTS